ncbi:hypothetical protein ACFX2J_010936 [Malus domestica]
MLSAQIRVYPHTSCNLCPPSTPASPCRPRPVSYSKLSPPATPSPIRPLISLHRPRPLSVIFYPKAAMVATRGGGKVVAIPAKYSDGASMSSSEK